MTEIPDLDEKIKNASYSDLSVVRFKLKLEAINIGDENSLYDVCFHPEISQKKDILKGYNQDEIKKFFDLHQQTDLNKIDKILNKPENSNMREISTILLNENFKHEKKIIAYLEIYYKKFQDLPILHDIKDKVVGLYLLRGYLRHIKEKGI